MTAFSDSNSGVINYVSTMTNLDRQACENKSIEKKVDDLQKELDSVKVLISSLQHTIYEISKE